MVSKCVLLLACLMAVAWASPQNFVSNAESGKDWEIQQPMPHERHVRSPQKGSVQIDYSQDRFRKEGAVQYNQNLHTSRDGRFTVDAYGRASRDFTNNRNDFGGGIQGRLRF